MTNAVVVTTICTLFIINLWYAIGWWRTYRDLRSARAVVTAVALLLGAIALAIATWALETHGRPEFISDLLRKVLVPLGQGVLLMTGITLVYTILREGRRP